MAAKKKKTAARRRTSAARSQDKNRWVQGIVMILLGIYFYYAFTTAVPTFLDKFIGKIILMYLFGNTVPFLCIVLMASGVLVLLDKFTYYKETVIYSVLIILNLMVVLSAYIPNLTGYKILDLFSLAGYGDYGGIVGIIFAYLLDIIITPTGTTIAMAALTIVEVVLLIKANFTDTYEKMDKSNFGMLTVKNKIQDMSDDIRQKQRAKEREKLLRESMENGDDLDLEDAESKDYAPDDSVLNQNEPEQRPAGGLLERSEDGMISVETQLIDQDEINRALAEQNKPARRRHASAQNEFDSEIPPQVNEPDSRIAQINQSNHPKTSYDPMLERAKKTAGTSDEKKKPSVSGSADDRAPETAKEEPQLYEFPSIELLTQGKSGGGTTKDEIRDNASRIRETFSNFGVDAKIRGYESGPSITRYEIKPAPGVKVSKITNLENDLALNLATSDIRIEAPIPGKDAVGIEVPNQKGSIVHIRDIIDTPEFKETEASIPFALGKTLSGKNIVGDISTMPHLLIAGATGSGKSVCINALIISMLYKKSPEELKMIMIDPKMVELNQYNAIPHLLIPVVTDPKKAASALNWGIREMTQRYELFKENSVRDIDTYNTLMKKTGGEKLPRIVIIIDELADLMMTSPKEVEAAICRIAQLARACGIHLIIATQRPSVDVITGLIKSNIPSRIAFSVASNTDSRTILDHAGAEKLLGKGDMLYSPVGLSKPLRVQCCYVSDAEINRVIKAVKTDEEPVYDESITETIAEEAAAPEKKKMKKDALYDDAVQVAFVNGQISTSMLQRRLGIGYARAGKIIDTMEREGIISGPNGSKPRKILVAPEEYRSNV